ncbi:5-oxoprolinase subunit PxpB [Clostridium sp. Marseille-Q2269]|uniref:5-oxoprolinase subunit PxpB n=1 Tax=Clostridium sp. Marseille-Q2269 TaxID=2942205 RepID=UPI0020733728|nr:5-oxoprolinase subunit PxpB [Clostridium sp. Marseille-Q2269]
MNFKINAMGDSSIIINLSSKINLDIHLKIKGLCRYLDQHPFEGMIEYVPAFTTLTIFYDPFRVIEASSEKALKSPFTLLKEKLQNILNKIDLQIEDRPRTVEIPVCYDKEFGPDLDFVAKHNNLSPEKVIDIHCKFENRVYMIGFAPGFPYLAGMSEKIATPRRKTPRLSIPEGSVGIAGNQTGVYSISTPGGWQLIGKTPLKLFNTKNENPSLLSSGDIIRFKSISKKEYYEIEALEESM